MRLGGRFFTLAAFARPLPAWGHVVAGLVTRVQLGISVGMQTQFPSHLVVWRPEQRPGITFADSLCPVADSEIPPGSCAHAPSRLPMALGCQPPRPTPGCRVDRHLEDQYRGRRLCTSYEQGVIGSELWAVRHQQRIRLEIDQREVRRAAQRKNRTC